MSGVGRCTTRERLARKTASPDENGCMVFTGHVRRSGYATIWDREHGKKRLVHRVAYELAYGPIPEGMQVDHVAARGCTSRACVNPAHLEAVTALVNTRRAVGGNARKTHCVHGHEFTPENTRYHQRVGGHVQRMCRRCDADRAAVIRERIGVEEVSRRRRASWAANREEINARRRARHAERKAA